MIESIEGKRGMPACAPLCGRERTVRPAHAGTQYGDTLLGAGSAGERSGLVRRAGAAWL